MEIIATITGYLVIIAGSVFMISIGVYATVNRIIDALGVRRKFLQMKRERNEAWATIRKINKADRK